MNYKVWFKKNLINILASALIVTTITSVYFIYETIQTNQALDALQVQFDDQVKVNLDLNEVIATLETQKIDLTQNLSALNSSYQALLIVKQNLESNIADLEKAKSELTDEVESLNTEISSLTAQVTTLETRITGLNSQIAASAAALSSLSSQLSSLSSQVSSLSSQNSQLSSQVSSLTVQVNNYVLENASQIDFAALNLISQEIMKANVRVNVPLSSGTSVGSGVIYKYTASGNKYYALTNNHVVKNLVNGGQITVLNYAGTSFNASKVAFNDSIDLAILEITGNNANNFYVMQIESASYSLANDTKVISLGGPNLQFNAITLGKVTNNSTTISVAGDKTYNGVIAHNAVINKGSSGGALINFSNKIVGINFAGDFTGQPDPQPFPYQNVNGFAIDLAKIYSLLGTGQNWSLS